MTKTKMKTGDYYSSDYSGYPLKSLRPFIVVAFLLSSILIFILIDLLCITSPLTRFFVHFFLSCFLFYWVYTTKQKLVLNTTLKDSIRERTKFEKKTAKLNFYKSKTVMIK